MNSPLAAQAMEFDGVSSTAYPTHKNLPLSLKFASVGSPFKGNPHKAAFN